MNKFNVIHNVKPCVYYNGIFMALQYHVVITGQVGGGGATLLSKPNTAGGKRKAGVAYAMFFSNPTVLGEYNFLFPYIFSLFAISLS